MTFTDLKPALFNRGDWKVRKGAQVRLRHIVENQDNGK